MDYPEDDKLHVLLSRYDVSIEFHEVHAILQNLPFLTRRSFEAFLKGEFCERIEKEVVRLIRHDANSLKLQVNRRRGRPSEPVPTGVVQSGGGEDAEVGEVAMG